MPAGALARIAQIWRYPVKSMHGEQLSAASLTPHGVADDRLYAFESDGAPPGMLRVTGRERRELLRYHAHVTPAGVQVLTPAGETLPVDSPALLAGLTGFTPTRLTRKPVPQTDCRPLSLISLQTVDRLSAELGAEVDPRRFRANLYLDLAAGPFAEDALVGQTLAIGPTAVIRILERDPRCRFITLDPDTTEPDPAIMQLLHRFYGSRAGVYASVLRPGGITTGDLVTSQFWS